MYEKIFGGAARVEVEFYDYTQTRADAFFFVVGRERRALKKDDLTLDIQIRTTRIFRLIGKEWKQIHHHGSMDDAEMLAKYQRAVNGKA